MNKTSWIKLSFLDIIFRQGNGKVGFSLQEHHTFHLCIDTIHLRPARKTQTCQLALATPCASRFLQPICAKQDKRSCTQPGEQGCGRWLSSREGAGAAAGDGGTGSVPPTCLQFGAEWKRLQLVFPPSSLYSPRPPNILTWPSSYLWSLSAFPKHTDPLCPQTTGPRVRTNCLLCFSPLFFPFHLSQLLISPLHQISLVLLPLLSLS